MNMDATYSPEDNKLRLYAATRLDSELYERVKAAGYRWAPKQELFVAPRWTPQAEDLALELAGEIGDEDTSLADRAENRADRFDGYSDKRGREAEQARESIASIADNIPLGQPILVGHHSEKRARRDAAKIENGMRKAVNLWKTSKYWTRRAAGVLSHAKYKERPDVRRRRIKTLEAERRQHTRQIQKDKDAAGHWSNPNFPLTQKRAQSIASHYGPFGLWSDLDQEKVTAEHARDDTLPKLAENIAYNTRWTDHLTLRIGYERALLGDDTPPDQDRKVKPKRSAVASLPLLNYPGKGFRHMTKAEWAGIGTDYKGTRPANDAGEIQLYGGDRIENSTHRIRQAMIRGTTRGLTLACVFLTDQKATEPPKRPERRKADAPKVLSGSTAPAGHHWRAIDAPEGTIAIPNRRADDEKPDADTIGVTIPKLPPIANAAGELELAL